MHIMRIATPFCPSLAVPLAFWAMFSGTFALDDPTTKATLKPQIGDCRPISREFTGINAKMLIDDPWRTDWLDALKLTSVGNIRYPGGTAGNDWDWETGHCERHKRKYSYLPAQVKPARDTAGVMPIWLVNIMTHDVEHSIKGLSDAAAAGLPIRYVEIGNEFYLNRYKEIFPTGREYGLRARKWIAAIKKAFPGVKCAVATTMKYAAPRSKAWTQEVLSACDNYDAVVAHWYVRPGYDAMNTGKSANEKIGFDHPDGPAIMIGQPILTWRDLRRHNDLPIDADVWGTEFGLKKDSGGGEGTWAHTLFTANQIHTFLDDGRVSKFCIQLLQSQVGSSKNGNGETAEDQSSSDSLESQRRDFHLSSSGIAVNLFARHTKNADRVAPLVFSDAPQVGIAGLEPYPAVVGWKFGNEQGSSAVLINFSDNAYEMATAGFAGPEACVCRMEGNPRKNANSRLIKVEDIGRLPATLNLSPYSITEVTNIASTLPPPERCPGRPVPQAQLEGTVYEDTETE